MLNCRLKVISPYNHGSSKCERQIRTISEIIMKHLWDKGQMWPLFATTVAYAMNTFASEALSHLSPFQLVFLRDPPDLTSLSFPKIDTIPVKYREYYNLLLARAQLVGNLLLEWRTKQALEYKSRAKKFRNKKMFQDNQMVYLLALYASALQCTVLFYYGSQLGGGFSLLFWSVLNFWGMFVRVYPRIVQGLTFLNSVKHITKILYLLYKLMPLL